MDRNFFRLRHRNQSIFRADWQYLQRCFVGSQVLAFCQADGAIGFAYHSGMCLSNKAKCGSHIRRGRCKEDEPVSSCRNHSKHNSCAIGKRREFRGRSRARRPYRIHSGIKTLIAQINDIIATSEDEYESLPKGEAQRSYILSHFAFRVYFVVL